VSEAKCLRRATMIEHCLPCGVKLEEQNRKCNNVNSFTPWASPIIVLAKITESTGNDSGGLCED